MWEAVTYGVTLALFGYVIFGTAWVKHDMLLLVCIPPMFVALIVGFVMAVYTYEVFGLVEAVVAPLLLMPLARALSRRYSQRDQVISIYLAWTIGMVFALVAFSFPDRV